MAIAKMTLIGMNQYLTETSEDLFSLLKLPEEVDADTLKNTILMTGGEFPVIWANPYFVRDMIGVWCSKMAPTFARWVKTLAIDYEPLYNYDRYEEYTDQEATKGASDGTTTRKVTGYDSDALRTNDQTSDSTSATGDRLLDHKAHLYGNIGVTTSQQMLEAEMDISRRFNIYELITEEFLNEFCLRIW